MISTRNRTGEDGNVPSRNDRVFEQDNYWYFITREGASVGPFDSKEEAIAGIGEYIDFITKADALTMQFLAGNCAA